jgi:NAD(P)-dependent dehydrogenase (short-subunit alcohol dehydrogenase family)
MPSALITGANRGLGLEFVRQFEARGWHVHAGCRQPDAAVALNTLAAASAGRINVHRLDLGDHASIERIASTLRHTPIDLLLNNAGTIGTSGERFSEQSRKTLQAFGHLDYGEWLEVLRVNVIGTAKVTEAFAEHVAASQRKCIVMISSVMGSITWNDRNRFPPGGGIYLYRSSKAALNMVARTLAADLHARGITVLTLNPGWVKTDMGGSDGLFETSDSVGRMMKRMDEASLDRSGSFLSHDGAEIPW